MIRNKTLDAKMAGYREYLTGLLADSVDGMPVEDCTHNDRPSCPKCARRKAIAEAADLIRRLGGVRRETPGA